MVRPVRVHLFAMARVVVGLPSVPWTVPGEGISARELVAALAAKYPRLAPTLRASRFLRNGRYLRTLDASVHPGDEFAVHPPYGGG